MELLGDQSSRVGKMEIQNEGHHKRLCYHISSGYLRNILLSFSSFNQYNDLALICSKTAQTMTKSISQQTNHRQHQQQISWRLESTTMTTANTYYKHNHHQYHCSEACKQLAALLRPQQTRVPISSSSGIETNGFLISSPKRKIQAIYFLIIIVTIVLVNINQAQCLSVVKQQIHSRGCKLNEGSAYYHELVEPMVVIGSREQVKLSTKPLTEDQLASVSIPLSEMRGCPNALSVHFSSLGDTIVIDLIKNRRLISDRYFQISKNNANRHNRHPDAPSKQKSSRDKHSNNNNDDDEFYRNHSFINLHNYTTNDDHCHYYGYVNDNLNFISAISIVDSELLSGFFHNRNEIYFLHANTTSHSTILTKSSNLCSNVRPSHAEGIYSNSSSPLVESLELKSLLENVNHDAGDDGRTGENQSTTIQIRSRRATNNSNSKNRRSSVSSLDNYIRHEPFLSNASSLYVELLVVHDHNQYVEYKRNTSNIAERTMQIVNIMNAFYRQLNIFVALVGVVLWVEKDEIQLTEDGDSTLTNFLKYRYEKLLPKYHHDNAQLITSTSFNGSVVGKALKGPICTHEHSGGVNTDHSHSPAIVAVTLAHELGHNFGMEHDEEDKCKCPDEKCIMSSSSSTVHPKHWSSCSIEYLEDARKHGLLDCLVNKPEKVFGPICGNGFVEDGEDCDIGEPVPVYGSSLKNRKAAIRCALKGQDCDSGLPTLNPCCDRQTCKFVANATCAQGPCCDLNRCSVYNGTETKICRPRQTECDLEEVCDGKSEHCPPDVHYHDGIECGPTVSSGGRQLIVGSASYNRSRAYCYNGKCVSHESQCQLLWGPSGSVSKDICYEQNVHGNTSGNCGFNRHDKLYESCESEDAICGMLHCVHNQPNVGDSRKTGKLGYGFESASILTVSFFVMSNHAKIYCHGAIIDAGPNARDPGLVPNGAACGEDKMCLNQKCTPVFEVVYKNWCPSDCNGNGVCDNTGTCHCFDGTIGTSCYQFFGPNFHLSLLLYIVMFFVPMIGLIVFAINHYREQIKIWWFLHNRKSVLRQKWRESGQLRRTATYDADGHKISISEPIPLSQNNNVNRPFYEPVLDPWAETSCEQGGKPLGYRLEPLRKKEPPVNLRPAAATGNSSNTLKPVRAAPPPPAPPPPVPSHQQRQLPPPPVPPHAPKV